MPENSAPEPVLPDEAAVTEDYRELTPAPEAVVNAPEQTVSEPAAAAVTEPAVVAQDAAELESEPEAEPEAQPHTNTDVEPEAGTAPESVDVPTTPPPAATVAGEAEQEPDAEAAGDAATETAEEPEKPAGIDKPATESEPARAESTVVAATVPPEKTDAPLRGRRRTLAKTAYSVGLVAILGTAIGLGAYEANADRWPSRTTEVPAGYGPPVDWNTQDVLGLVDPGVLTGVEATTTEQGVIVTARTTPLAEAQPRLLAQQLNTLTQNSCATNIDVRTSENLKINSWGFCFTGMPEDALLKPLAFAQDHGAAAVSVTNHPRFSGAKAATITWMPTTREEYDEVLESWGTLSTQDPLEWIALVVYGAGEMDGYMDYADVKSDDGLVMGDNSRRSRAEELGLYPEHYPSE